MVMVDEETGEKYARIVEHKGLQGTPEASMDWLVVDMSKELQAWGHSGGLDGHMIIKSDKGSSITSVISALREIMGTNRFGNVCQRRKSEQWLGRGSGDNYSRIR